MEHQLDLERILLLQPTSTRLQLCCLVVRLSPKKLSTHRRGKPPRHILQHTVPHRIEYALPNLQTKQIQLHNNYFSGSCLVSMQLPSGNLNIDLIIAVACVRSAFTSNLEMIDGSTGHLRNISIKKWTAWGWTARLPFVIDQRNARVLFVEGKAILHFDSVCSVGLRQFCFNGVLSAVNGFADATLVFQEFQNDNGVFIAIESCFATSNHIKFIVSQFKCSMNPHGQLNWSLLGALNQSKQAKWVRIPRHGLVGLIRLPF